MQSLFRPSYFSLSALRFKVAYHFATIIMLLCSVQPSVVTVLCVAWVVLHFARDTAHRQPPWRLVHDLCDTDAPVDEANETQTVIARTVRSTGERGRCELLARYGSVYLVDLHWEGGDTQGFAFWPDAMSSREWCHLSMKVALCLGM